MGRWLPQMIESQRIWDSPLAALAVTGTQVLAWIVQLAGAVAMLWAFHLGAAGLGGAALVIVLTNLIGLVPATPGNVGTFQVAAVAALATAGVAAGPALAFALGLQALQLVVGIVAGLVAHERPGHVARRSGRPQPPGGGRAARRRGQSRIRQKAPPAADATGWRPAGSPRRRQTT